jgi:hypothetical protein
MSPQTEMMTSLLKKISLWALIVLIGSGMVVAGVFYYLQIRRDQVMNTEQQLSQDISQQVTTEGLLMSVKRQVTLINVVLGVQKPVGRLLTILETFISPSQLSSVSLDDQGVVLLTVKTSSITDVVSIVDALTNSSLGNTVRSPQLVSLSVTDSGNIAVVLSFHFLL